ncbi:MAG: hypothetical protein ACJ79H_23580, partial [Myxococcales bacterium]
MGHEKTRLNSRYVTIAFAIFIGLFVTTAGSIAQANSTTTFSGQASVLQVTVPPLSPITVVDTSPLPSSG